MSSHEFRAELISRLIRELVAEVLHSKIPDEKTLQNYEQLAINTIKNHRSISVNRYEVRRQLDALKEKFVVDNFKEYADHLEHLCGIVLTHPVCLEHYEVDIQWSLLEFLCSLAYNPTGNLRRNPLKISIESPEKNKVNTFAQLEELYIKKSLRKDFISVQNFDENSDLSDWSDSEAEQEHGGAEVFFNISKKNESKTCSKIAPHLPALEPPIKEQHYRLVEDRDDLHQVLKENVQCNWWLDVENSFQVLSNRKEANFARLLDDYIKRHARGFLAFRNPITIDEFCLLRELLWIFHCPRNCKFFSVQSGKCKIQKNTTVPSISVPTLTEFLKYNILPYVDHLHSLRTFLKEVYDCQDQRLPRTFEHYAANLKLLVDPILIQFVELEQRIIKQKDFEINTLITLQSKLRSILERLQILHTVHIEVVLDYKKYPAHITSSFLLTSLMQFSNMATTVTQSNLAICLFLASTKAFCNIIDCWWNEGRLDDWQSEFLVECSSEQKISFRLYSKDEEKSFFLPKYISKVICENRFMHIMMEHAMEAGYTLNLLYEISRIGDLRNECGAVRDKLYDSIISDVFRQVRTFQKMEHKDNSVESFEHEDVPDNVFQMDSKDDACEQLTTNDEFLLLLFGKNGYENQLHEKCSEDTCDAVRNTDEENSDALELFGELEKYEQMLPLEELIISSFARILRERVTFANKFVVDLYRENVNILGHLQNIRKVLLLEASDIMQQFYIKLFKQIEDGHAWANAFVLTMQLDDIISSKYPEMSALFRLEINSVASVQTQKVTEAVEALTVNYSFSNELSKIITEEDMKTYNEVFRFLLKVKWGLATLENLKFSRVRERPPYAPLEMGDFLMRRLEQLRFWMFYGVQCVHSHLTMHVLQAMGTQLDEKLLQSTNVREMESVHNSYLATISKHCFLNENLSRIKFGIEQLLNLVSVIRSEWQSCLRFLDHSAPFSAHISGESDDLEMENYAITAGIDSIELTYIRCHQYLANMLNNEVYIYQNTFLSGLSAAFNTSLPC